MTNRSTSIMICFLLVCAIFIAVQCGTVASVRPIGKGKSSVALSSGGPVAPVFDIQMPIPYSVFRYRRGLTDNLDLHCGIHPTMMVLGNIALEVGVTKQIMAQQRWQPALSLEGCLYGFCHASELSSIRAYPEIGFVGSYAISQRGHIVYFGIQNIIQYDEPYWVFAPLLGSEIVLGKFNVDIEAKWYAPIERSDDRVVDYAVIPAEQGALGFVWGLSYRF